MSPKLQNTLHPLGVNLRIIGGLHKGQAGILEDFDSAAGRYSIRLLSNGKVVTVEPDFTVVNAAITTPEGW